MSKRPHTKSRLGCSQCKRRRVKCDNKPPRCGLCSKRGIDCDYQELLAGGSSSTIVAGTYNNILILPPSTSAQQSEASSSGKNARPEVPSSSTATPAAPVQGIGTDELLLMHHYTLHTSQTIGVVDSAEYHDIWQQQVPMLAKDHPFIMHGLLAISASHMAHLGQAADLFENPLKLARHHYSESLRLFYSSIETVDRDQVDAVFCFTILVLITTFSLENAEPPDHGDCLPSFSNILGAMRGGVGMLASWRPEIVKSKVGILLSHMLDLESHPIAEEVETSLARLEMILASQALPETQALTVAISQLRMFYTRVTPTPANWKTILQWPIRLAPEFVQLLEQGHPVSLAICAHWYVAMHCAPKKWFVGNLAERMVKVIWQRLEGGVWEEALEWPVRKVLDQSVGVKDIFASHTEIRPNKDRLEV